eukprot:4477623-Pyramimonas_sp.AAC.1
MAAYSELAGRCHVARQDSDGMAHSRGGTSDSASARGALIASSSEGPKWCGTSLLCRISATSSAECD